MRTHHLLILACLLIATACTPAATPSVEQEHTAPEPIAEPAPPTETADAGAGTPPPAEEEQAITPDEPDFPSATEGTTFDGPITRVACDKTTRTLTFTIANPTGFILHLDKDLPFPSPKGHAFVALSMNAVEMNGGKRTFNDETLFGKQPFSSNCDTVTLEPGDEATCTVSPVPLRTTSITGDLTNDLSMNTQGVYKVVTFTC